MALFQGWSLRETFVDVCLQSLQVLMPTSTCVLRSPLLFTGLLPGSK